MAIAASMLSRTGSKGLDDSLASALDILGTVALGAFPIVIEFCRDPLEVSQQFIRLEACLTEFADEELLALLTALRKLDAQRLCRVPDLWNLRDRDCRLLRSHAILDRRILSLDSWFFVLFFSHGVTAAT